MSVATPAQGQISRRVPRHRLAVPVNMTLLRCGVPDCLPGRSLDLSEAGMAAIVAGEVAPGDTVGVEFRLPDAGIPFQAKAVVRHQARLRCGVEFVGLSVEQQATIRSWSQSGAVERSRADLQALSPIAPKPPLPVAEHQHRQWLTGKWRWVLERRLLWATLAVLVVLALAGWWHWYEAWKELESHLPRESKLVIAADPGSTRALEPVVTYRVDPVYPHEARRAKVEGVVLIDATVTPDGTVVGVKPVSGPALLAHAAADAVRSWRFAPYKVDGKVSTVQTTVAVEFRAPR
jgi:TonB family protein